MSEREPGFPFAFTCRRTGNCCSRPEGFVRVEPADVTRLSAFLDLAPRAFASRYLAARGDRLIEGPGGRCPFLEEGHPARCRVHPARPQRCRTWPFWPELRDDPEALREARRFCPGIQMDADPAPEVRRRAQRGRS